MLARPAADNDQGEGYHGDISRNQNEGCYHPWHFLQIGELEDGIISACDDVDLRFWALGSELCYATEAYRERVTVSGTDGSFGDGRTGISTLNMYGAYHNLKVCEAFAIPD